MGKIDVGRRGKFYTLNGATTRPEEFIGIDGFKFVNHIFAWIKGGAMGEGGGAHLSRAKTYLERDVVGLGCKRMRSPVELMFWGPPYFDQDTSQPSPYNRPNLANTMELVNLNVGTGSGFSLTPALKKAIRMFVLLAREFDIVIEVPWLWTIKGEADGRSRDRLGIGQDPRNRFGVSVWNEHFLAAHGVGAYLELLHEVGDGEGETRVDPGGINILSDFANEYTVHADVFTEDQLRNMARRWNERDAPHVPVNLISQSGAANRYDPPLESQRGKEGYDGPTIHPPRSSWRDEQRQKTWDWDESGTVARLTWPGELIDMNESQLALTQEQRDFWVPLIPKWAGLGTTNLAKWIRMHRDFIANDCYTTLHTFRGMDAAWPVTPQTAVEEAVRELTNAGPIDPPPPETWPPADPSQRPYDRDVVAMYRDLLGREPDEGGRRSWNDALELYYLHGGQKGGSSVEGMRDATRSSTEFRKKNKGPWDFEETARAAPLGPRGRNSDGTVKREAGGTSTPKRPSAVIDRG